VADISNRERTSANLRKSADHRATRQRLAHAWLRLSSILIVSTTCVPAALAQVVMPDAATSLRDRYAAMTEQLEQSPLGPGLYLESVESSRTLQGDVYAVVNYPLAAISEIFASPDNWCAALILHLNVKYCRAAVRGERTVLTVAIGKKIDQPLDETYRVEFTYSVAASTPDYGAVGLYAKKGPLGTKNYNIALQFIGLEGERAFLHVRYSYEYGFLAGVAMRIYLATSGQSKIGFTTVGGENGRPPRLIGGVRGALERNAMRYYLAIDAYLATATTPAPERFDESLERWFAATEHYAAQLHEVEHDAYVTMKRGEYLRQQILP